MHLLHLKDLHPHKSVSGKVCQIILVPSSFVGEFTADIESTAFDRPNMLSLLNCRLVASNGSYYHLPQQYVVHHFYHCLSSEH
jgi:hypothetical protein